MLEAAHALLAADGTDVRSLDRIVVGVGPGGFTGLRIGIATALGLAQSLDVECVGASSLAALGMSIAAVAPRADVVVPVLDARRREVFAAVYAAERGALGRELLAPSALAPAELGVRVEALGAARAVVGGAGLAALDGELAGLDQVLGDGPQSAPRAANLAVLASSGRALPVQPVYARMPDAERARRAGAS